MFTRLIYFDSSNADGRSKNIAGFGTQVSFFIGLLRTRKNEILIKKSVLSAKMERYRDYHTKSLVQYLFYIGTYLNWDSCANCPYANPGKQILPSRHVQITFNVSLARISNFDKETCNSITEKGKSEDLRAS